MRGMSPQLARRRSRCVRIPVPIRSRLAEAVAAFGEEYVRAACGVSRNAFARALGGLPVLAGTVALVERGLGRLDAEKAVGVGHA